jgi:hypothetical protein
VVSSNAGTVSEYLAELPPERRAVVAAVRKLVRRHLPQGYREAMGCGMIVYEVPLARYPKTYNGKPLAYLALAPQKHYALYVTCAYIDEARRERLRAALERAGQKFDFGKSRLRFRLLADLEVEAVAAEVASLGPDEFIRLHEAGRA